VELIILLIFVECTVRLKKKITENEPEEDLGSIKISEFLTNSEESYRLLPQTEMCFPYIKFN